MSYNNNQPLYVVNGVPYDADNRTVSSGLNDIDPNSIENISVLKGAAASALYGNRAANGVILITTKSGSFNSKPKITVSHTSTFDKIYEIPLQNVWAQGVYESGAYTYVDGDTRYTSTSWGPKMSDLGITPYDRWQVFETGYTGETSLSFNGGNEMASYYVGVTNLGNNGIVDKIGYDRTTINANTSFRFTDKLTVSSNFMYSTSEGLRLEESNGNSSFMNTLMASPASWNPYPIYDPVDGHIRLYRGGGRDPYLYTLDKSGRIYGRERFVGSLTVDYQILPTLKFSAVAGVSNTAAKTERYFDKGGLAEVNGYFNYYTDLSRDIESTEMLTYDNRFGDFNITGMVGHNISQNTWEGSSFEGSGILVPGLFNTNNVSSYTAGAYRGIYRAWSLFGEARIGYKSMVYYTFSGRNDWVSSLSNDFFYSSHSLSFVFTELMQDKSVLTFGKVRASYGKVGGPPRAYATNVVLSQAGGDGVSWPFNGQSSFLPDNSYPNPGLTNEFKHEMEFGLDMRFLNGRFGIDAALYKNWSENQIISEQLLSSTGYSNGIINIGGITHRGVELSLTGTAVKAGDFTWDVILNWSKDVGMVDKLGTNNEPVNVGSAGWAIVGEEFPVLYGPAFLRDNDGNLVLSDQAATLGSPILDPTGSKILGNIAPDWIGGLRNTFRYKSFTLIAQLDMKKGGLVMNFDDHYLTYYGMAKHQEDRPEDDMIVFEGVAGHFDYATQTVVTSGANTAATRYSRYFQGVCQSVDEENIQPAGYIKLRELVFAYDLPASVANKVYMQGLKVSFIGRNLWRKLDDGFYGPDPETNTADGINNGSAWFNYSFPAIKTYAISVTATF
ncbi:MAG: SusC/RagA family TonB-linked outer membrane protein [Bacteroidales bacterium]